MKETGLDNWPIPNRLLIVIVNYKTAHLSLACLRSLELELRSLRGVHVALVENASGEDPVLREALRADEWENWVTLLIAKDNRGFGAGNNVAIKSALASGIPPQFILLLNAD